MIIPVYLFDVCVGQLNKSENSLTFTYDPEWLNHPKAQSISNSLPLREKPYKGKECQSYFSGLLPEDTIYNHFCSELPTSHDGIVDLLRLFGFDCKGAIKFKKDSPHPSMAAMSPQELEDLIRYIPIDPHFIKTHNVASMLPGKQAKATIAWQDNAFCKPSTHFISTHIIKTDFNTHDQRILNEVFCLTLAKKLGLKVSKMTYMPFKDMEAFVTDRFDRIKVDHDTIPIHCEDFCQALGYFPEQKYECDGGPGLKDCVELIRTKSNLPIMDIKYFVDSIIFNLLIGNNSGHGKNYSLIYHPHETRLSPLHDVMCTEVYTSSLTAMSINNKFSISDLKHKDFDACADHMRIGKNFLKSRFLSFAHYLPQAADAIISKNSFLQKSPVIQKIRVIMEERCKKVSSLVA